jgi:VanZ family protein
VTPRLRVALSWVPAILYMAMIWVFSSIETPLSVADIPFEDKGAHALEYAGLSALLLHAFLGTFTSTRALWLVPSAMFSATLWGLLDEIHQAYVPGRNADVKDLAADAIGAVIGALVYYAATKVRRGGR